MKLKVLKPLLMKNSRVVKHLLEVWAQIEVKDFRFA
jgi:hypothetical protein